MKRIIVVGGLYWCRLIFGTYKIVGNIEISRKYYEDSCLHSTLTRSKFRAQFLIRTCFRPARAQASRFLG